MNHHYKTLSSIEPIDLVECWKLNPYEFSAIKYLYRRGIKSNDTYQSDILKAVWYLVYALTHDKNKAEMVIQTITKTEVNSDSQNHPTIRKSTMDDPSEF